MAILIACEESQIVTCAFRELGYEAYSCDIRSTHGDYDEWHIKGDVREILNNTWDAVIAFPPCTHLCISGARWFKEKRENGTQQRGINFFLLFTQLNCSYVAIENPVGIMSTHYRKPDQIIQPWQFGHGETKATCLWLQGLPLLRATHVVSGRAHRVHMMSPGPQRSQQRSRTYRGIAVAMAHQWGPIIDPSITHLRTAQNGSG